MSENRGKDFERVIKHSFENVQGVSLDRLHDQTTGYKGSSNICDFIVYKKPYQYYIECKSVHGNTLPFRNITKNQWNGLLEKSKIEGVFAGVICWWVDKDKTVFIPIQTLELMRTVGMKSVRYDAIDDCGGDTDMVEIKGKKKRVFFDYDIEDFLTRCPNISPSAM